MILAGTERGGAEPSPLRKMLVLGLQDELAAVLHFVDAVEVADAVALLVESHLAGKGGLVLHGLEVLGHVLRIVLAGPEGVLNGNVGVTGQDSPHGNGLGMVGGLEILQEGQNQQSARYFEAVVYNKKLLTTNDRISALPFYNPDYMKVFHTSSDVDIDWLKARDMVDYGYKGEFSPSGIPALIDKYL